MRLSMLRFIKIKTQELADWVASLWVCFGKEIAWAVLTLWQGRGEKWPVLNLPWLFQGCGSSVQVPPDSGSQGVGGPVQAGSLCDWADWPGRPGGERVDTSAWPWKQQQRKLDLWPLFGEKITWTLGNDWMRILLLENGVFAEKLCLFSIGY